MIDWLYHSIDRVYVVKLKVVVEIGDAYDVEGAADMLVVGVATIWRWISSGKIASFKLQDRTLISKSEVDRIRKERAAEAKTALPGSPNQTKEPQ